MDTITAYQQAMLKEVKDLPEDSFPNLLQIVHLFKTSVLAQRQKVPAEIEAELAQWDRLSDEALLDFEKGL